MVCATEAIKPSLLHTHPTSKNMTTLNNYYITEQHDQELTFDELQAINAAAPSDDVMAVGATMVTCGAGLLRGGAAIGFTGPVGGFVAGLGAVSFVGGMATTFVGFGMKLFGG